MLDPCCGSGTSAFVAAATATRGLGISRYFGCDISHDKVIGAKGNWEYLRSHLRKCSLPISYFEQRDATGPWCLPEPLNADIVFCNPPWGENHLQAYHKDREAIIRQLGANQDGLLKTGAVGVFITNGASRVKHKVYREAGWIVDQTVRVAADQESVTSDRDLFVTFCVFSH